MGIRQPLTRLVEDCEASMPALAKELGVTPEQLAQMGYDEVTAAINKQGAGVETAISYGRMRLVGAIYEQAKDPSAVAVSNLREDKQAGIVSADVTIEGETKRVGYDMKVDAFLDLSDTPSGGVRFRMSNSTADFKAQQAAAVKSRGLVMPGLNEGYVRVVSVPRHEFTGSGKEALQAAEKWAKEHIVGSYSATDSDGKPFAFAITKDSVEKYVSSSATKKSENIGVHLAVLQKLPEVISNGIEVEVHPSYKKGRDGVRSPENGIDEDVLIHRFYSAINIDGTMHRVKTTMIEYADVSAKPNPHSYEVTKVEVLPESSENTSTTGARTLTSSSGKTTGEDIFGTAKLLQDNEKAKDSAVKIGEEGAKEGDQTKKIEVLPESSENTPTTGALSFASSRGKTSREDILGTAKLLQGVEKSYDKGVKVLEASEKGGSKPLFRDGNGEAQPDTNGLSTLSDEQFFQAIGADEYHVANYADAIKRGKAGRANYALRTITHDAAARYGNHPDFLKVLDQIRNRLYRKYGNLDELREKAAKAEMEARGAMEAAQRKAEEERKAERQIRERYEQMTPEELDAAYMKAVEANDEQQMRYMVDEAAQRKGYSTSTDWRMGHRAPGYDPEGGDYSMSDIVGNRDGSLESLQEQFRMGRDKARTESINAINKALAAIQRGKDPKVTIYRAVPADLKESHVRNGDWVTLSHEYAKRHGEHALAGNYRIMEEQVPASILYWDANDINEWGFDDKEDYAYSNTPNNRKLNDLVVRDDNGAIIPLSKRFDASRADVRFRFIGEQGARRLDAREEATARIDNLAVARQMEQSGRDAYDIKIATGWERGADHKWRYEQPDFEFASDADLEALRREDMKGYNKIRQEINRGAGKLRMLYYRLDELPARGRSEEQKAEAKRINKAIKDQIAANHKLEDDLEAYVQSTRVKKLSDCVRDANGLFDAYPQLANLPVEFKELPEGIRGRTHSENGVPTYIVISSDLDRRQVRSTLAHEVQHAIQKIEGFAPGGTPGMEVAKTKVSAYAERVKSIDGRLEELEQQSERLSDLRQSEYEDLRQRWEAAQTVQERRDIREAWTKRENELIEQGHKVDEERAQLQKERDELANGTEQLGFGDYQRLAGEVEARNVQNRIDYEPEDRRNSPAFESEDVAREHQIFLNEALGNGDSASTSREIEQQYPGWTEGTTTESGKHTTQVEGTRHQGQDRVGQPAGGARQAQR
jgi:hypothetical protein